MKYIKYVILVFVVSLLFLTIFGPWSTYRTQGANDGLGPVVYVTRLPVWLGEIMPNTISQQESKEIDKQHRKWRDEMIKKSEEEEKIKCPMCGRKKAVIKQEDHLYYCKHCDMQFDDRED